MPYDLCEDEPTLDVIETCMAYQGKGKQYVTPWAQGDTAGNMVSMAGNGTLAGCVPAQLPITGTGPCYYCHLYD